MNYFNTNIRKTQMIHNNSVARKREENLIASAFHIAILLSVVVLRDEFDFGGKRIEKFIDRFRSQLDSYNEGHASVKDFNDMIFEETGVRILDEEQLNENYKYREDR